MYPFQSDRPYLLAQWYAAAFSHEVGRDLLERQILNEPVLLYRLSAGGVAALHGVCPHRMLPLSKGCLVGDEVACGYHGFQYDAQGRCTRIPTQPEAPAQFRLRHYPVAERGGMVWIWMGDPSRAAAVPLPDLERAGMGAEHWTSCGHSHTELKARWALMVDNLFDLTHIGWIHAKTIGASVSTNEEGVANVVLVPPTVEDDERGFSVRRRANDVPIDPFHRFLHPQAPERVDMALYTNLVSVGLINAGSAAWEAGSGRLLGNLNFVHLITPRDAHSIHYFGMVTRDFRIDDAALSAMLGAQDNAVRLEDKDVVELVEQMADRHGDTTRELSARADAGSIRLRRKLDAMLQAEAASD